METKEFKIEIPKDFEEITNVEYNKLISKLFIVILNRYE